MQNSTSSNISIRLSGFPPFDADDPKILLDLVAEGKYGFPPKYWGFISEEAKDLVSHLLEKNPDQRYNVDQFLNHKWFLVLFTNF
jgi:serine/threonine protein kinase